MPRLLQNLVIHYYANKPKTSPNQSKEEEFSLLGGRQKRVKESYQFVSNWPLPHKKSQICQIQHETGFVFL